MKILYNCILLSVNTIDTVFGASCYIECKAHESIDKCLFFNKKNKKNKKKFPIDEDLLTPINNVKNGMYMQIIINVV